MKFISKPEIALIFPLVFFILLACSKDAPFPEEPAIVNYNFAVSASEGGSVNSPGDSFAQNTTLTLTATADDGYEFTSWSGDASGTDNPLTVSLTSNTNITANFERIQYTLTVNIVGQGQVNQVLGDNSITSTTVEYNQGDRVTLQTNPGDNWTFSRWQGDATGYEDNFEILVDGSKTVTATFDFEVIDDLIGAWDIASDSSSDKKMVKAPNSGKDVICGFYALIFNPDYSFTLYYSLGTISGEFYIQDPTSISLKNYGSITNISFAANGISFNLELDTGCSSDISGDKDDDYDPENPPKSFLEKLDGKYFRGTWEEYERTFTDLISFKNNLPDDFLDLYWIDEDYECILGTWNSSHIAEVIENYDDQLTFRYTSGLNFKVLGDASASPMEGTMSLRSDGTIQIAENFQDDDLDRIYILSEVTQEEFNQIIDSGYCYDIDITPPIITLNGSSTIQLNIGENWTDPGATATDDLDGDLTSSISVTGSVDASSVGTYTLTYTVADAASNTASTTRTVTVSDLVDTTPPVITLNGSSTIQLNIGENWTDPGAAATDDVDGDVTSLISTTGSVDTSSVGTYTLTYSVEDAAGNSSSITRTVVVKTPELPSISLSQLEGNWNIKELYYLNDENEITQTFEIPNCAKQFMYHTITSSGTISNQGIGINWPLNQCTSDPFDVITNQLTLSPNGNRLIHYTGGIKRTWIILDRPDENTLIFESFRNDVSDNYNGNDVGIKIVKEDRYGILPPTITLNGSSTINLILNSNYSELGATATDDVDGNLTSLISITGSVDTSSVGTYTLTYSVEDAAGNSSSITRTVVVKTPELPSISLSQLEGNWNIKELYYLNDENEITQTFEIPNCAKQFMYHTITSSGTISNQGIGINWPLNQCTSDPFDVITNQLTLSPNGNRLIHYTGGIKRTWIILDRPDENTLIFESFRNDVSDNYNGNDVGIKIVKEDRYGILPPTITLNGSSTINLILNSNYSELGATATDDVDGNLTSLISITGSVDTSSVGTYTLTYSVEDAAGNSSSITRTVVVKTPELIIADYRFEGDAQDSSGNSNHGTNNGGVFTTDRFGNQNGAIYFSGASCGTRMDSDIDMSTVINEFSISFWINRTANGCQLPRIFDFYDGGNNSNDWGTAWQNGNNKYQGYDEVSNNNNWYHIVHNFNSNGTLTSFVDGVEVDSRNSGKTLPLSGDFALGRMNHPAYDAFNGKLDDVKMYNYALSQSEINVLFGNYANDTTAPTISLTGSSTINLTVGDTFTDPGATATDNVDGDITSSITTSGSVNTSTAGTYTISYSVSDAAGNTATVVQRTVIVSVASSISFVNGTCECPNAIVGDTAVIGGVTYTVVDDSIV